MQLNNIKLAIGTGGLLLLGYFTFASITDSSSFFAQVIQTDKSDMQCIEMLRTVYPSIPKSSFKAEARDINSDGIDDYIVKLTDPTTCGSGGCIHEFCIVGEGGVIQHIPFGHSAHSVNLGVTIQNDMRDIYINGDQNMWLVWSGKRYEFVE